MWRLIRVASLRKRLRKSKRRRRKQRRKRSLVNSSSEREQLCLEVDLNEKKELWLILFDDVSTK